jgi:hypothetical protein
MAKPSLGDRFGIGRLRRPKAFARPLPPKPPFGWGRGVLHALLALGLVVLAFAVVTAVVPVADPRRFGEGVGRFSFFVGLAVLGVSWLAQTGRRLAAWVVGGLLFLAVVAVFVVVAVVAPKQGVESRARPLPTEDLVRADGALRHPSLGFAIPDPGPSLTPQPDLARQLNASDPEGRAWVYADPIAGEVVMVVLTGGTASNEGAFSDFFEGTVRGQTAAMGEANMTGDVRERSIQWSDRRAHAYVVLGDAIHQRIDVFGLPGGETMVLVSAAPTAERFAGLADGVRAP